MIDPYADQPAPAHEWEAIMECGPCEKETDHLLIEWRDPGYTVTRECLICHDAFEFEDERP